MLSWFKKSPVDKLRAKRKKLLEKSVAIQRSGDLKTYAQVMKEVDDMDKEIAALS